MTQSWLGALCAETDPELFFPEQENFTVQIRQAKRICATCPLTQQCLAEGLKVIYEGIWGGATVNERKRMRRYPELIQTHLSRLRADVRFIEQAK